MGKQYAFEVFPGHVFELFLFKDVKNSSELLKLIRKGDLEVSFVNPQLVGSEFQVKVAANKAMYNKLTNRLVTKNVHSELLYVLYAGQQIMDSLKTFGINEKCTLLLVGFFDTAPSRIEEVVKLIEGTAVESDKIDEVLQSNFDEERAKKHYKISKEELEVSSVMSNIINRIASSDAM